LKKGKKAVFDISLSTGAYCSYLLPLFSFHAFPTG